MQSLLDVGIATGPVLGYVHQYRLIKTEKSVGSFSIDICGILLFANILRLNFYIFNQYELALFFQSLIMIVAQIFLVHICTKYAHKKSDVKLQSSKVVNHNYQEPQRVENFWRWNQFSAYFLFIIAFSFITLSVSLIFKQLGFEAYGVIVGFVALLSQSVLIAPQILKNYLNKSTKGLSHILVILNLSGDIFKLFYFLMKSQPFQFVMCGVIQVCLDSFVIAQIFYYKRLESQAFQKENKSLIIQKKSSKTNGLQGQTQQRLDQIEMKDIDEINSPEGYQAEFQPSYIQNNQDEADVNSDQRANIEQEIQHHIQPISNEQEELAHEKVNVSDSFKIRQKQFLNLTVQAQKNIMRKTLSEKPSQSERQLAQNTKAIPSKSSDKVKIQV